MHTAPFIWMHILTLICNLLLYISYSSMKGERPVDAFRGLLMLFILCPATSICQRLFLWPGPIFWLKISQVVLMLLPMSIYYFLLAYVGRTATKKEHLLVHALSVLLVIPSLFDVYLGRPSLVEKSATQIEITYPGDWKLVIPVAIALVFLVLCIQIMRQNRSRREFIYIRIGIISMLCGNVVLVLPGNTFPWDMLGGMINCIMLAIALSRLKLLRLRISLTFNTLVFMASLTSALSGFAIFEILASKNIVKENSSMFLELWIASTLITMLVAYLYSYLSRRTSLVNSDHLLDTSRRYSEAMMADMDNRDQIIWNLKHVMLVALGEVDTVIYLYDKKKMIFSAVGREHGNVNYPDVSEYSKLSSWLCKDQRVDASSSMMWTLEKDIEPLKYEIKQRKLNYIVPFISDGKLLGFMLFGFKTGRKLKQNMAHAIDSIVLTTSLALQNQDIYRHLEEKLTEDNVTGLYNRAFFDEHLDGILKRGEHRVLYIPDMDDMKLFNQVYGARRGDEAMRLFSFTLRECAPENSLMSRYEGKMFAVLFPGTIEKGVDYDKKIRKDWALRVKGTPLEHVCFSSGLMMVDGKVNKDSHEAITLGRLAVKKAKRLGKNQLCLFTPELEDDENLWETGFSINTAEAISQAIDLKDRFTYNHSAHVARYARELAIDIGLSYYDQQLIYEAGLIHDVGKIAIPDRILTKPGKLSDEEYALMKTHVESGHNIISASAHGHLLVPLAENHHERWDGTGYPKGLKGEEIPIGGRCLAIADAFDAMTGKRIYKDGMSKEDAVAELRRCEGTQFDPELTERFIHLVDIGIIDPKVNQTIA